jgi:hypothetical protein
MAAEDAAIILQKKLAELYQSLKVDGYENPRCAGMFTPKQIREVRDSNNCLLLALQQHAEGKLTYVDDETIYAYKLLALTLERFNTKTCFNFDGTIKLFECIELLGEFIEEHKTPALKMEELQKSQKDARKKGNKNPLDWTR